MRRNAGMSLIEIIIASIILVFIFGMSFMVLWSATDAGENSSISSELQNSGRAFVEEVKVLFRQAYLNSANSPSIAYGRTIEDSKGSPVTLSSPLTLGLYPPTTGQTDTGEYRTEIIFKIPVGRAANGELVYGYTDKVGLDDQTAGLGGGCIFRYEVEEYIRESSGAPAAPTAAQTTNLPTSLFPALSGNLPVTTLSSRIDINRNGSYNDLFARGRIRKYVVRDSDGDGNLDVIYTVACPNVVVRVPASNTALLGEDMDMPFSSGAGLDPVFRILDAANSPVTNANLSQGGRSLEVTVFTGTWDRLKKAFIMKWNREIIRFRNPQS